MKLFREALEWCREPGDLIYFRPADDFVPRAWVEAMPAYEWECEESGLCPKAKEAGCYAGAWTESGDWICRALLVDSRIIEIPFQTMIDNLEH